MVHLSGISSAPGSETARSVDKCKQRPAKLLTTRGRLLCHRALERTILTANGRGGVLHWRGLAQVLGSLSDALRAVLNDARLCTVGLTAGLGGRVLDELVGGGFLIGWGHDKFLRALLKGEAKTMS